MARILIIDDDPINRDLLSRRLKAGSHEPMEREDGESGLAGILEEKPDLVIMDVMMPKIDGFTVCQRVRANPAVASTPIILLTAHVDDVHALRGAECGANEYVSKPWNAIELIKIVNQLLEKK